MGKHDEDRAGGRPVRGILRRLLGERQQQEREKNSSGWPLGRRRQRPHSSSGWWPTRGH